MLRGKLLLFLNLLCGTNILIELLSTVVCSLALGQWRLFCVRGEAEVEASLVEVDCQRASLRSRASLVLLNAQKGHLYLWHGCKAHTGAKLVAKRAADKLTQR